MVSGSSHAEHAEWSLQTRGGKRCLELSQDQGADLLELTNKVIPGRASESCGPVKGAEPLIIKSLCSRQRARVTLENSCLLSAHGPSCVPGAVIVPHIISHLFLPNGSSWHLTLEEIRVQEVTRFPELTD